MLTCLLGSGNILFPRACLAEPGTHAGRGGRRLCVGAQGARRSLRHRAGTPVPLALASARLMHLGEQQRPRAPGQAGQGSWVRTGHRPRGLQNVVGDTRKVTSSPETTCGLWEVTQTHSFGYSAGTFGNHMTAQILRCWEWKQQVVGRKQKPLTLPYYLGFSLGLRESYTALC